MPELFWGAHTLASADATSGQLHIAENRMVKILMNDARRYWSVLSMSYLSEISVRRNGEASLHGARRNSKTESKLVLLRSEHRLLLRMLAIR